MPPSRPAATASRSTTVRHSAPADLDGAEKRPPIPTHRRQVRTVETMSTRCAELAAACSHLREDLAKIAAKGD